MAENIAGVLTGGFAIFVLFIGLPWLILHFITKWKTAATLSKPDEDLLDDMHDLARRLDERVCTIERIMDAENPGWRAACLPDATARQPRLDRGAFQELRK